MSHDSAQADYEGRIIIARELLPSELLKLAAQRAAGLVLLSGAATSHVALLARSLRLPTVLIDRQDLLQWVEDQNLLLDAIQGTLFIEPDAGVQASYQRLLEERQRIEQLEPQVEDETHSSDGVRVRLLANINLLSDLEPATRLKAEGIGLYRSEFPFIVRDNFPTEEEQYRIYQRLIDRMNGKPVTLRTLDIGGDKSLSYAPNQNEPNPFLGLRAIRYSLRNRPVFTQQLRAMLRAGVNQQLKIMFPLISSVDEFVQAKEIVHQCIAELAAEELPHNPHPQLGLMVELPSAVELIEELAQEADFLSIGTNDLIQYMLAVDRTNEQISDLYVPYHPAVLRALYRVAEAALRNDIEASICGDIAADPHMMVFLLGCGIRSFSVDARHIPYLQQHITRTNVEEARRNAMKVLRLSRIDEITASLGLPPPA
jgi:phosphotransferase system enzyme I (PtsP)